jgi:hypothetical protein
MAFCKKIITQVINTITNYESNTAYKLTITNMVTVQNFEVIGLSKHYKG